MKFLVLFITLVVSLPSLGHTHKIIAPAFPIETLVRVPVQQTNLIRLYMRLPSERRMIAGYKEERVIKHSKASIWADDLRSRLKTTNGKIRL
jgi:hypothetical protein